MTVIYLIFLSILLAYAAEDVYEINGSINADAKSGDPVDLESPLNSPYVEMVANIKSFDAKAEICGYTIYGASAENMPPFVITISNKETGEGQIFVGNKKIDPNRAAYTFEIAPHICQSGRHLQRSLVSIEVEPGREVMRSEHPSFTKSSFKIEVTEGRFYDPLIHLDAQPGSTGSPICHYHVVATGEGGDVPFTVDNTGYLRNTLQLDAGRRSKYRFKVTAEDCQHRVSEPASIDITVRSSCVSGWIGIPDRIEFEAGQGGKTVAETATLELCDQLCNVTKITTSIRLSTSHIGKGCDRDTYSLKSLRKLCGGKGVIMDLLPPTLPHAELSKLHVDDGHDSDEIFSFDGMDSSLDVEGGIQLTEKFTFAMWMKHDRQFDGHKEQVACTSDADGMNRHHFSISLRHCHMILLLRREPNVGGQENSDTYYPSEWKWSLPEICDSNWHHYAINVDNLQVSLYIDGHKFDVFENNPEIFSDFPLHKSKHVHAIKTVVGACWQGGKQKMSQHLRGYLAGVSILLNGTEGEEVLTCLNNCLERLTFNAVDEMETGMTVSMNTDMTQISISGSESGAVTRLVRKIGYTNERSYPTPGHRPITFDTKIICDKKEDISIEQIKSLIMVSEFLKPKLTLSVRGNKIISIEQDKLTKGVNFLLGIQISSVAGAHKKEKSTDCDLR